MHLKTTISALLLVLGLSAVAFANKPEPKTDVSTVQKQLQQVLDDTRKEYNFAAMSLTVIDPAISKEPMNFMSGSTKKKGGKALKISDYYQIGSNTKSFIAALLVKLAGEQKLSLDDSVSKWLPEYPHWKDVTVANLLHNNSGIPSYTKSKPFLKLFEKNPRKAYASADLADWAYKEPVLFKAGEGWDYSNTNWILAGMIAEKVTGKKLSELLNSYFLSKDKLNLSHTLYWPTVYTAAILPHIVHGYDDEGVDVTGHNMSWANAAGAIIASNEDLAHWGYALFHGQALNKNELAAMQSLVSVKTGKNLPEQSKEGGYGMGIGRKITAAGPYWGHEGHTLGYHSIFAFFPDQDVTIAMHADGLKNADFGAVLEKIMKVVETGK